MVQKDKDQIWTVGDPIGDNYIASHSAAERRKNGSVYTPLHIVEMMISDAKSNIDPDIVVDCGCGSGRFALAAARAFPNAVIYAVDSSSLACEMCAENVRRNHLDKNIKILNLNFMDFELPSGRGKTLWIGNPPYVRHHEITKEEKNRLKQTAGRLGVSASALSGLHVHFIAHIAELWQKGDYAELLTSAEWLDIGYGSFVRKLLTEKLPIEKIQLFDRKMQVFAGTNSTAIAFAFSDFDREAVDVVAPNGDLRLVNLRELRSSDRWFPLLDSSKIDRRNRGRELVPLGSMVSVHRGVVTGNNNFWVRPDRDLGDVPEELTVPIVSRAKEIMGDCEAQNHPEALKKLIVLPDNLESLPEPLRTAAARILEDGLTKGVDRGYIARSRRAWWSIKPPKAPAVMMTYMSRSGPTFVKNDKSLPMLNTIHGLYPKVKLSEHALSNLTEYLNLNVNSADGRVYCGGLVKYEPREVEAIMVPPLEVLEG